jgi:hypothetical protein
VSPWRPSAGPICRAASGDGSHTPTQDLKFQSPAPTIPLYTQVLLSIPCTSQALRLLPAPQILSHGARASAGTQLREAPVLQAPSKPFKVATAHLPSTFMVLS